MIVFDTNVFSEAVKREPDPAVVAWIRTQTEPVATTAVTIGELFSGVRRLPHGQRRTALAAALEESLTVAGIVLPYDERAARLLAEFTERRRSDGRPLDLADGMIAAICASKDAGLATRNVADFDGLGLRLINPWDA